MIAHGNRPAIAIAPDAAASTASRPNVRDDGQRPSFGTGWRELVEVICPMAKVEYFCDPDWTGQITLRALQKTAQPRTRRQPAVHA